MFFYFQSTLIVIKIPYLELKVRKFDSGREVTNVTIATNKRIILIRFLVVCFFLLIKSRRLCNRNTLTVIRQFSIRKVWRQLDITLMGKLIELPHALRTIGLMPDPPYSPDRIVFVIGDPMFPSASPHAWTVAGESMSRWLAVTAALLSHPRGWRFNSQP